MTVTTVRKMGGRRRTANFFDHKKNVKMSLSSYTERTYIMFLKI